MQPQTLTWTVYLRNVIAAKALKAVLMVCIRLYEAFESVRCISREV